MNDKEALRLNILLDPFDITARMIYADYIEKEEPDYAAFIRHQCDPDNFSDPDNALWKKMNERRDYLFGFDKIQGTFCVVGSGAAEHTPRHGAGRSRTSPSWWPSGSGGTDTGQSLG